MLTEMIMEQLLKGSRLLEEIGMIIGQNGEEKNHLGVSNYQKEQS